MDVLIALGHSGYEKDKELASRVPHLDLVVGGQSHSFLYEENKYVRSRTNVESNLESDCYHTRPE